MHYVLRKPIQAIQYQGPTNCSEIHAFLGIPHEGNCASEMIDIAGGTMTLTPGHYIVSEDDQIHIIEAAEFERRYIEIGNHE
jgi:hypothetical protein